MSPDEFAASQAELWRNGLAKWDEGPDRIRRYCDAVDRVIYTPGSSAGIPITVLKSFHAPPPELVADADAFGERIASATSGLLALLGIDADPVRSREHILLSNVLDASWRAGRDLDLRAADPAHPAAAVRQDRRRRPGIVLPGQGPRRSWR